MGSRAGCSWREIPWLSSRRFLTLSSAAGFGRDLPEGASELTSALLSILLSRGFGLVASVDYTDITEQAPEADGTDSVTVTCGANRHRLGALGVLLVWGGQRFWGPRRQVAVEAGAGDSRGFDDLGDG
jgi:hypothetical protein